MMKEIYEAPVMDVVEYRMIDVIKTSDEPPTIGEGGAFD